MKSAWRDYTQYSVQIVTKYCSLVGPSISIQKTMESSMLHRNLMFGFVFWCNRQVLRLLMICIYVDYSPSMYGHQLPIVGVGKRGAY